MPKMISRRSLFCLAAGAAASPFVEVARPTPDWARGPYYWFTRPLQFEFTPPTAVLDEGADQVQCRVDHALTGCYWFGMKVYEGNGAYEALTVLLAEAGAPKPAETAKMLIVELAVRYDLKIDVLTAADKKKIQASRE